MHLLHRSNLLEATVGFNLLVKLRPLHFSFLLPYGSALTILTSYSYWVGMWSGKCVLKAARAYETWAQWIHSAPSSHTRLLFETNTYIMTLQTYVDYLSKRFLTRRVTSWNLECMMKYWVKIYFHTKFTLGTNTDIHPIRRILAIIEMDLEFFILWTADDHTAWTKGLPNSHDNSLLVQPILS